MKMDGWRPDLCIYHGGCDDGFGAAWAVNQRWPDGVEYYPAGYNQPPPDVTGRNVLIVDFSYKYDVLAEMGWKARRIVVLDHHKTAQAALERLPAMLQCSEAGMEAACREVCWTQNIPEIVVHFDMEKSGARLAWEFCFPDQRVPPLISHIEDRDLWKFALVGTAELSAVLRTHPHDFDVWDRLNNSFDHFGDSALFREGSTVLRGHRKNVESFIRNRYWTEVGGVRVPVVNVPYHYASDCADAMLKAEPDAPFCASWFRRSDGKVQWSLRSRDDRMDVSEIAKSMGGGGHRNAAGFEQAA